MRETRLDLDSGWTVVYGKDADRDGNPAVVSLRIESTEPGMPPAGGITGTLLRTVPMGRVLAQTYEDLTRANASYEDLTATGATYADIGHELKLPPQRGRRHDPKFLLLVASLWDKLVNTSSERSLFGALVTELESRGHVYQPDGARQLVRNARAAGFLELPRSRGKIGGGLTDKARQLLRD